MTTFKYYASLRATILEIVTGIENSEWSFFWDDTTPNWITKRKLEDLYKKHLKEAKMFGLYVVTRHCDCPNPAHEGYPVSNDYGLTITYGDERYIWNGGQMYQGSRYCACPCSPKNNVSQHNVIDDVIYDKNADQELCKKLEYILSDVAGSIDCARDKKPRSGIRENLLRALLRINDQLLPEPMEMYIKRKIEVNT